MSQIQYRLGDGYVPPDEDVKPRRPRFLKLAPGQRLNAVCLSHTWCGAITHFVRNRQTLCRNESCPFCAAGSAKRFYAWLHAMTPDASHEFIVQLASSMRPILSAQFDRYDTLRGAELVIQRQGKAPNTPTTIEFTSTRKTTNSLPLPADLERLLLRVMDPTTPQHQENQYEPETPKPVNGKAP